VNLGAGCQGAEGGVDDDLFDLFFGGQVFALVTIGGARAGFGFGRGREVEAGDLEAVEEEPGAAGVDLVGGDAAEDFADGGLDGGAVLGERQAEGGLTGAALFGVGDGSSGGVVVVAELFAAKARTGTAAAVGEDVAALKAFGFVHGVPPPPGCGLKSSEYLVCGWTLWVKSRSPAWAGLLLFCAVSILRRGGGLVRHGIVRCWSGFCGVGA
jgi:hypothetical protein